MSTLRGGRPVFPGDGLHVLLISANTEVLRLLRAGLDADELLQIEHYSSLEQAKKTLRESNIDACFLDLELPDGRGIQSMRLLPTQSPIVAIARRRNHRSVIRAVRGGADDVLYIDELDGAQSTKSLRCAIERAQCKLKSNIFADSALPLALAEVNDRGLRIVRVNRACIEMSGHNRRAWFGDGLSLFCNEDALQMLKDSARKGRRIHIEQPSAKGNGSPLHVAIEGIPVSAFDESTRRILYRFEDITEPVKRDVTRAHLRRARILTVMINNMVHHCREPISDIDARLRLAVAELTSPADDLGVVIEALETSLAASREIAQTVLDIYELASG